MNPFGRYCVDSISLMLVHVTNILTSPISIDRVVELEATVKRLELQLEEQEEDANNVIDKWQESCAALDEKCSELERQLEGFRKDNETVKHSDNDGDVAVTPNSADREQRTMSEARFGEEEPAQRIEELEAQLREKEQSLKQLQETLVSDEAVVQQWEGMLSSRVLANARSNT